MDTKIISILDLPGKRAGFFPCIIVGGIPLFSAAAAEQERYSGSGAADKKWSRRRGGEKDSGSWKKNRSLLAGVCCDQGFDPLYVPVNAMATAYP